MLQETKLQKDDLASFGKRLGFRHITRVPTIGASRGMAMIWDPHNIRFSLLETHGNWISGRVTSFKHKLDFLVINVYGPTLNEDKRRVWKEIEEFRSST
ncbi:hypothetical protein SUGI_0030800 [Cryptomeria japonica]|nr:hypothetical protein SUGI_0030800 [Cryptomeria japonica]